MLYRTPGLKSRDMLLLYDNCRSHTSGFSGWWCRNIRAFKLTITPYTPEFNMIERFFNTFKANASDGVRRDQLHGLSEYFIWHMN